MTTKITGCYDDPRSGSPGSPGSPPGRDLRDLRDLRALRAWLDQAELTSGPLFRPVDKHGHVRDRRLAGKAVARIVKRLVTAASLDPRQYSGHSLRAGLATAAAIAGVSERAIMNQTGHKSSQMVRRYIREADIFRNNAAAAVL